MTTLNGALPGTQAGFAAMKQYLANNGIGADVANYGGVRTQADTAKILQYRQDDFQADVNAGRVSPDTSLQAYRPISPYGSSYHNYGAAFDLQITSRPSGMSVAQALAFAGAHASALGLRWGGTFRNPDPPHFELAIPLADAKAKYAAMTGGAQAAPGTASIVDQLTNSIVNLVPDYSGESFDIPEDLSLPDDGSVDYSGMSTDDSGADVYSSTLPDQSPPYLLYAAGGLLIAVVAWALQRKLA